MPPCRPGPPATPSPFKSAADDGGRNWLGADEIDRLRGVFVALSADGSGHLGLDAFADFARLVHMPFSAKLMFSFIDLDFDGRVAVGDYVDWLSHRQRGFAGSARRGTGARPATDAYLPGADGSPPEVADPFAIALFRELVVLFDVYFRAFEPDAEPTDAAVFLEPDDRDAALDGRIIFPNHVATVFANRLDVHLDALRQRGGDCTITLYDTKDAVLDCSAYLKIVFGALLGMAYAKMQTVGFAHFIVGGVVLGSIPMVLSQHWLKNPPEKSIEWGGPFALASDGIGAGLASLVVTWSVCHSAWNT